MGQDIPSEYPDSVGTRLCAEYKFYSPPPIQSRLYLCGGAYRIAFDIHRPMPNWWWRMWQRVFFGFHWEKV